MNTAARMSASQKSACGNPNTLYWAFQERSAEARDLGHKCKECGNQFLRLNDPICLRRGGRIELKYHKHCFSGKAYPRTQGNSTFHTTNHALPDAAPTAPFRKMRASSQF